MTYLTHKLALASALSVLALGSVPALASAHEAGDATASIGLGALAHIGNDPHESDTDRDTKKAADDHVGATAVAGTVTSVSGTDITLAGNDGVTYRVEVTGGVKGGSVSDVYVGDSVIASGSVAGSIVTSASVVDMTFLRAEAATKLSHVRAGIVTAVSGSTFTIESLGAAPKTIVTTDASTVIKDRDSATTSSAITVGSQVFVLGTTTASSATNDSFSASVVRVLGAGLGHLKFWLWFR